VCCTAEKRTEGEGAAAGANADPERLVSTCPRVGEIRVCGHQRYTEASIPVSRGTAPKDARLCETCMGLPCLARGAYERANIGESNGDGAHTDWRADRSEFLE
jgi:hypothetical protein